jgi:hypothetical protein
MTLRLNQFARVVLIFDERHIPAAQAVPAKPGVEDDRAPVRQRRSQLCSADLGTACDIATPSKTVGGSRPYGASCDCALVKAATALISIIATTNPSLGCCLLIDQLPFAWLIRGINI